MLRSSRYFLLAALALAIASVTLASCGNKGPLVRAPADADTADAPASAASTATPDADWADDPDLPR